MSRDEIKEIKLSIKNIESLLTILVKLIISPTIKSELDSDEKALIYQMTGDYSRDEIAKESGLSTGHISGLWSRWEEIGLVIKEGRKYKKVLK